MSGVLHCGDNLDVLYNALPPNSVDLIYLDPPFNSQRSFNIVYKDSRAQQEAFKDYWSWSESASTYEEIMRAGETPKALRTMLRALHDQLITGNSDLLAYLAMMAARLVALHRVLKPTGTLYLHCDPTASHYLKILLDAIFGGERFVSEIVWKRTNTHSDSKRWSDVADTVLFYSKGSDWTWNPIYADHSDAYLASKYRHDDGDGRGRYMLDNMTSPNPRPNMTYEWMGHAPPSFGWRYSRETMAKLHAEGRVWYPDSKEKRPRLKRYLDDSKGALLGTVWTDINPINSRAQERLGYPTQKPLALLERIITASSNPGDIVLDPFCGCGTTIEACERLDRRWIGIDIASKAIEVIEERFVKMGLPPAPVTWHPVDPQSARALATRDKRQFEEWVRRKLGARKRKKDRGIDGEAFFRDRAGKVTHVIISVKGGKLQPTDLRDLRGTIEREEREGGDATIGVLVSVDAPKKEMRLEAARAEFLDASDDDGPIPRLQLVRVDEDFFRRYPVRVLGTNITEMPKPDGEQLKLALNQAKPIKSAPRTKPKAYEIPEPELLKVAERRTSRPPRA